MTTKKKKQLHKKPIVKTHKRRKVSKEDKFVKKATDSFMQAMI